MRSRVKDAIEMIGSNGWVKELKAEKKLSSRCDRLFELFPEIGRCGILIIRNHFLFEIQKAFSIKLGICKFFWVDGGGHQQYCLYRCQRGGLRLACTCEIPQSSSCKIRGGHKRRQKAKTLCL